MVFQHVKGLSTIVLNCDLFN